MSAQGVLLLKKQGQIFCLWTVAPLLSAYTLSHHRLHMNACKQADTCLRMKVTVHSCM